MLSHFNKMIEELAEVEVERTLTFNMQMALIDKMEKGGFSRKFSEDFVSKIEISLDGYMDPEDAPLIDEIAENSYKVVRNYYNALKSRCENPESMILNFASNMKLSA